jgi:hypothetical protein
MAYRFIKGKIHTSGLMVKALTLLENSENSTRSEISVSSSSPRLIDKELINRS